MELFIAENPPITLSDIQEFETAKGLTLPEDHKAHLLQYNGAEVESIEAYFGVPDDDSNFSYFHPLKYGDSILVDTEDYLPEKHITIGCTSTGYLAMSLTEDTYGHIYVYYSEVELKFLAASFTEFIEGLIDYDDELN